MSLSIEELTHSKVFSASRHLEDSRQAPSSVSVITVEDIRQFGWRTLGDALGSLRGFYTSYDRDYTHLGVRGFLRPGDYNSRVLLLLNGHRLNDNVFDGAYLGTEFPLDLDLVDHIEVVRGPSSSLFGTNAVFGVINVITRQDDEVNDENEDEDAQETESEVDFTVHPAPNGAAVAEDDWSVAENEGRKMVERSHLLLDKIHEEDREEVIDLNQAIESAIEDHDAAALKQAVHDLREMMFFVEGRA